MAIEIEHKYLVIDDSYKSAAICTHKIMQGYLSDKREQTVRIRTIDEKAFVTIKGITKGASRLEYEYEIPFEDAVDMLQNVCLKPIISKTRHIVEFDGERWEIDEFHESLTGLTLAEIELPNESHQYSKPNFIGKNVTGDTRYYNSNLAKANSVPK